MAVTVRQKRKGKGQPWHVFIHQEGIIRSRMIGDKRAAEAVASALRRKIAAGEFKLEMEAKKAPEFSEYAQRYLEGYAKVACKRNTWEGYETIIDKHLNPAWKGKRLDQITRAEVKQLILAKQQEGFSPKTVENIKALISGIFTHAYEDEILAVNPALKLGRFISKHDRKKDIRPLTREQATAVLKKAEEHFPDYHPLLLCAFRTGMRLGELLGLAWEDIDFASNTIEVRRAYTHGRFETPKSRKSRVVDMSDQLKQTLLAHRSRLVQSYGGRQPACEVPGRRPGEKLAVHLAFPSETGGPLDGDNFRKRVFYRVIELADVPQIRFHDIRHTFASLLLQQGESLHYVKEQMGHASIQTTVDVYGHLVPGSNRNAVNRLDDPAEPTMKIVPAAG